MTPAPEGMLLEEDDDGNKGKKTTKKLPALPLMSTPKSKQCKLLSYSNKIHVHKYEEPSK